MSIYDKTYTWSELVETAQQHNESQVSTMAMYLCRVVCLDPDDNIIGPFLCRKLCQSNLEGITLWVKEYLMQENLLPDEVDLGECETALRFALHLRVPAHLLEGLD